MRASPVLTSRDPRFKAAPPALRIVLLNPSSCSVPDTRHLIPQAEVRQTLRSHCPRPASGGLSSTPAQLTRIQSSILIQQEIVAIDSQDPLPAHDAVARGKAQGNRHCYFVLRWSHSLSPTYPRPLPPTAGPDHRPVPRETPAAAVDLWLFPCCAAAATLYCTVPCRIVPCTSIWASGALDFDGLSVACACGLLLMAQQPNF